MATYKVWLTVKNSAGNTKEIDVGNINVDATLTPEMLSQIEEALPLEEYLKKTDIETELNSYATDDEVATAKSEAIDTAKSETLAEVSTKYVTADTENNLSLNGQTIVLCGGNASSGTASAE